MEHKSHFQSMLRRRPCNNRIHRPIFTNMIDSVQWFTVTSSVVVFKVTPTSVLVDSVEVVSGENIGDGSVHWGSGFDKSSDVSVGHSGKIFFHGGKSGFGDSSQNGGCDNRFHVFCICLFKLWFKEMMCPM